MNKAALKAAIESAQNWPVYVTCKDNWFVDASVPYDFVANLPLPPDSPPGEPAIEYARVSGVTPNQANNTLNGLYPDYASAIDRGEINDVIGIWEQHL